MGRTGHRRGKQHPARFQSTVTRRLEAMRTTTLGSKGLEVGVIGLGCMGMTYSFDMQTPRDDATSIALIHQALDLGMTLIDTADAYGPYTNEVLVGRALAGGHRDRAVLATKVGLLTDSPQTANPASNSPGASRDGRGACAGVDRRQPAPARH